MSRHVLIGIHGVSAPKPGEVVDELLSVPSMEARLPFYKRSDLASEGRTIVCAEATAAAPFDMLLELNWRDQEPMSRATMPIPQPQPPEPEPEPRPEPSPLPDPSPDPGPTDPMPPPEPGPVALAINASAWAS